MQTCQLCYSKTATVDGKTKMGPWAFMCEACHTVFGVGLGVGKGQRLPNKFLPALNYNGRGATSTHHSQSKGEQTMAIKVTMTFSASQAAALVKALGTAKQSKTVEALTGKVNEAIAASVPAV